MAGPITGDTAEERPAKEGEVAGDVQKLVPDKFIGEAKRSIHDFFMVEDDRVLK